MKVRKVLLLLVMSAASGCEGKGPIAGPTPPTAPAPSVAIRVEGRVLNADREGPVTGAVLALDWVSPGNLRLWSSVSARTDDQGNFSLPVEVPSGWRELGLVVTRLGFEPNLVFVRPGDGIADVRLVPTLVIRPGESIEVSAFVNSLTPCFIESAVCRRVIVDAALGQSVDLEVLPVGNEEVRLAGPLDSQPFSMDDIGRRVTTSRGEVYIVPMSLVDTGVRSVWVQKVTLKAHKR